MELKTIPLLIAISLASHAANAASPAAIYDYVVGGGNPITGSASKIGVNANPGVAWNSQLSCNDFSLDHSLKVGFDTGQVKRMQTQVIGQLKNVFNPVGLIGTSIRRADPGLYEMIMNGSEAIKKDYEVGIASCQEAQNNIVDLVMGGKNKAIATSNRWEMHSKKAKQGAFDLVNDRDMGGLGDEGIQVGGEMKGGVGQAPISTVADTSRFGFNALTGRALNETSGLGSGGTGAGSGGTGAGSGGAGAGSGGAGAGSGGAGAGSGGAGAGSSGGIEQVFSSPQEVKSFLVQTVGESSMRTCEGCPPVVSVPGQGAKVALDKEREKVIQNLNNLLSKPVNGLSAADLNSVSAGNSVRVTKEVVEALKDMPASVQPGYIDSLATDIATARTVDKLLYARQTLVAGRQESSLAANPSVQEDVKEKIAMIDDELNTIEREIRIKRHMAKNTATAILQRDSAVGSSAVTDSGKIM